MYPFASAYFDNSTCADAVDADKRRQAVIPTRILNHIFLSLDFEFDLKLKRGHVISVILQQVPPPKIDSYQPKQTFFSAVAAQTIRIARQPDF